MKGIMDRISEIIQKWPSESRVRGMNVLANLIKLEVRFQHYKYEIFMIVKL